MVSAVGRGAMDRLQSLGRFLELALESVYWSGTFLSRPRSRAWGDVFSRMVQYGVDSIPVVSIICLLIGMIMALQTSYQLERYGATVYVTALVGVSITRELGPLMAAIITAGRSGSAISAEIGTMKVDEEVDALVSMAIDPVRFLVSPKLLAMVVMLPCLTVLADLAGIFGGFAVGVTLLSISPGVYLAKTADFLAVRDVLTGLIKSVVFALVITWVGCHMGFLTSGGAEGVGRNTTRAVVVSTFLVIVADVVFTTLFYYLR